MSLRKAMIKFLSQSLQNITKIYSLFILLIQIIKFPSYLTNKQRARQINRHKRRQSHNPLGGDHKNKIIKTRNLTKFIQVYTLPKATETTPIYFWPPNISTVLQPENLPCLFAAQLSCLPGKEPTIKVDCVTLWSDSITILAWLCSQ